MNLTEILPFLIPLICVQAILLIAAICHIFKHTKYKRGNRILWLVIVIVGMEFWGPIVYFLLGKEDA